MSWGKAPADEIKPKPNPNPTRKHMSKEPTAKRITILVKVRIDVKPGIEPVGVLDLALCKMHDALDQYESRNRDEVTDTRMSCDIRHADVTDLSDETA